METQLCCSVLQCVAVYCSVLQCLEMCCSVSLQMTVYKLAFLGTQVSRNPLKVGRQYTTKKGILSLSFLDAWFCELQCIALHCNVLCCVTVCCSVLQRVAACRSVSPVLGIKFLL